MAMLENGRVGSVLMCYDYTWSTMLVPGVCCRVCEQHCPTITAGWRWLEHQSLSCWSGRGHSCISGLWIWRILLAVFSHWFKALTESQWYLWSKTETVPLPWMQPDRLVLYIISSILRFLISSSTFTFTERQVLRDSCNVSSDFFIFFCISLLNPTYETETRIVQVPQARFTSCNTSAVYLFSSRNWPQCFA